MPSSIGGFKEHPLYALERHLHRDQVIHPKTTIGNFRGEAVYARSAVTRVKTAENWMRTGRTVAEGQQPLKLARVRAVTVHKKRALEMALAEAEAAGQEGGDVTQGLYAEWQTVLYVADPVVDVSFSFESVKMISKQIFTD